ncbi:MAG: hypothetical protein AAF466_10480 [Bacteroidota bacterium]
MSNSNQKTLVHKVKTLAGVALFILGMLVFVFSLISGSEEVGLLQNSFNGIPWLALLILIFIAFRRPVLGGLLVVLYGLGLVYFFNFRGVNFFLTTFIITMIIPLLGFVILGCGYYLENVDKARDKTQ